MGMTAWIGLSFGVYAWQGIPAEQIPLSAASAILIDGQTGVVLMEKNADVKRHPASTTKIMTSILLMENCALTDVVVAPNDIANTKQSSAHLKPGEKMSVNDLLHAVMLRSANDATVAGAIHVSGSVANFADLMTKRAKEIGCTNTSFTNPHGLTAEGHLTTARDLARMGQKYLEYPVLREIARTQTWVLTRSINQQDTLIQSRNELLKIDLTIDGIKTGWTIPAGKCFVGSATRNGRQLISVVMKTEAWQHDTLNILNWGFANITEDGTLAKGTELAQQSLENADGPIIALASEAIPGIPGKRLKETVKWSADLKLPVAAGAQVGTLLVTDGKMFKREIPLVSASEVKEKRGPGLVGVLAGVLGIGAGVAFIRYRRQRSHEPIPQGPREFNGSSA
jgi:serine-type D-Ala-D-Ala carboxypeptidase (penicillin-binding protein 5/6)